MTAVPIPVCQCPVCQQEADHPDRERHRQINLLLSRLEEHHRRWYAALESNRIGRGGDHLLAQLTGLDEQTIRRGRAALAAGLVDTPPVRRVRVRRRGSGRPPIEKRTLPS